MNMVAEMLLHEPAPVAIWGALWLATVPAMVVLANPTGVRHPGRALLDACAFLIGRPSRRPAAPEYGPVGFFATDAASADYAAEAVFTYAAFAAEVPADAETSEYATPPPADSAFTGATTPAASVTTDSVPADIAPAAASIPADTVPAATADSANGAAPTPTTVSTDTDPAAPPPPPDTVSPTDSDSTATTCAAWSNLAHPKAPGATSTARPVPAAGSAPARTVSTAAVPMAAGSAVDLPPACVVSAAAVPAVAGSVSACVVSSAAVPVAAESAADPASAPRVSVEAVPVAAGSVPVRVVSTEAVPVVVGSAANPASACTVSAEAVPAGSVSARVVSTAAVLAAAGSAADPASACTVSAEAVPVTGGSVPARVVSFAAVPAAADAAADAGSDRVVTTEAASAAGSGAASDAVAAAAVVAEVVPAMVGEVGGRDAAAARMAFAEATSMVAGQADAGAEAAGDVPGVRFRLRRLFQGAAARRQQRLRRSTEAVQAVRYSDEVRVAAVQAGYAADRWQENWELTAERVDAAFRAWQAADSRVRRSREAAAFGTPFTGHTPSEYADRERHLHLAVRAAAERGELPTSAVADALTGRGGWNARLHPVDQELVIQRASAAHLEAVWKRAVEAERTAWQDAQAARRNWQSLCQETILATAHASAVRHLLPAAPSYAQLPTHTPAVARVA